MAQNFAKAIKGNVRAIGNRVLVSDMYFGEQKTASGLIIKDDNGTTRGIYPRWGKVYAKGPDNKDDYNVGDWILIEHGRWTRGIEIQNESGTFEIRMVEAESILAMSNEKPAGIQIGAEYNDGEHATIDPSAFMGQH
jgi:co-chaperonin GroES (HSP10)